jgi:hypothetical protein
MSDTETEKLNLDELKTEISKRNVHCPDCGGVLGDKDAEWIEPITGAVLDDFTPQWLEGGGYEFNCWYYASEPAGWVYTNYRDIHHIRIYPEQKKAEVYFDVQSYWSMYWSYGRLLYRDAWLESPLVVDGDPIPAEPTLNGGTKPRRFDDDQAPSLCGPEAAEQNPEHPILDWEPRARLSSVEYSQLLGEREGLKSKTAAGTEHGAEAVQEPDHKCNHEQGLLSR